MSTTPVRSATTAGPEAVRDRLWQAVRAGGEYAASGVVLAAPGTAPGRRPPCRA
ncbi:hypothetical protein [Streptomyces sp. NPDC052036]|uniref:hypothetical protein n=1 Tax=unclassified Streptomyces TaxID=2593676 RepID=UPI00342499DE